MSSNSPPYLSQNKPASNMNVSCNLSIWLDGQPDSPPKMLELPKFSFVSKQIHPMGFSPILSLDSKLEFGGTNDAFDKVRRALMTETKSKHDVLTLAKFLESTTFFHHFSAKCINDLQITDLLLFLSQYASYERVPAGKTIFQEGEKSEGKVYLILTGEVNVFVNKIEDFIKAAVMTNIRSYETLALLLKRNFVTTTNGDLNPQEKDPRRDISPPKISILESNSNIGYNGENDYDLDVEDSLLQTLDKAVDDKSTDVKSNEMSPGLPRSMDKVLESPDMARILDSIRGSEVIPSLIPKSTENYMSAPTYLNDQPYGYLFPNRTIIQNKTSKISQGYGNVVDKLQKGEYFGGSSPNLMNNIMTVVSKTDCEFLIISEEIYLAARMRFEKQNMRKMNFLIEYFPGMETIRSKSLLYELFFQTEEKRFGVNAYITTQGSPGKTSYMLYEGMCNLYLKLPENNDYKEMRQYGDQEDQNKQDGILVCKLTPGMFIGEEILFNPDKNYEFTVKTASANVSVLSVNLSRMAHEFPPNVTKDLKQMHLAKNQHLYTSASQRVKLKVAVFPLMKSPLLKRSRTNLSRKDTPNSVSAQVIQEQSQSPPRETPIIDEKISSFFRISKFITREMEERTLRNPSPSKSHPNQSSPIKRKLLAQVSQRDHINTNAQDQINSIKLRFANEERVSPLRRRVREKSMVSMASNLASCREYKSIEPKPEAPKLKLQISSPDLDLEKTKALTKDLLKKFKAGQSRSSKRNWNNISISMVTDRSARAISPEETKLVDNEKSPYHSQIVKRSEANKSALSHRGTESLRLEPTLVGGSPQRQRKLFSRQKSNVPFYENPIYGLTSNKLEKKDKQMIKLSQVCVEAGFYSGIKSKNRLFINTDRKID